ncbi:MAG TPA: hypothetical protein VJ841_00090 [Candidatus Saccharimonadales bacterium]|nr:hypothetical protein [Candidatus Saccharimonadales bacterium]
MVKSLGGGYKKRCGNCNEKLQFTRSDVRAGAEIQGSEDRDHKSVITCPSCHRPVDVTSVVGSTSYETAQAQDWDDRYL